MSFICLNCIHDEPARDFVAEESELGDCDYCHDENVRGIDLEDLAIAIDDTLQEYCQQGHWRPAFNAAGVEDVQEGDSLEDLLHEELEIDYDAAEELARILEASERPGDERFYERDQNYHRTNLSSWPYSENWESFSRRIRHHARFFDAVARQELEEILGAPGGAEASQLPVLEIGPGTRISEIFRARLAESEDAARSILDQPAVELGPPSAAIAPAGRMNPAGISVFYGALSEVTAIAEVRPSVAGLVTVGRFIPSQRFRLLDLSRIGVGFAGSIFHPNYANRAARLKFLQGFHHLISRPVQPRDEQLEYIPTQAVAEYVSNVLGFDGILYASAQTGTLSAELEEPSHDVHDRGLTETELSQHNIVLFGQQGTVSHSEQPEGLLTYQPNSARVVQVTGVHYDYEARYLRDEDTEF